MKRSAAEAQAFEIPGGSTGRLYPDHPRGEHTLAVVTLDGVYPEEGLSCNEVCTETLYLVRGHLEATVADETSELGPGDMLVILPRHPYRLVGDAEVVVVITPAWRPEQNRILSAEEARKVCASTEE